MGRRCELAFSLAHQHCRAAFERAGDLEDDRQRGHVLAALALAHVRALDASQVRQRFLRNAALRPQRAHRRAEGLRQLGIVGGGAGRSAALNGSLLHRQKRQVAAQLKPRYL
ncbi:hypothetical protein G6F57_020794 [Rhizopus arrhizus]|nr:hypothetical protein G6F57_020794 [Rhizopus arrhizus]